MGYLIGTDEAGYGPNLGPLVISATVWEAPDGVGGDDLFDRLSQVIPLVPSRPGARVGRRVAMADSKRLYKPGSQPGKGLRHLERGLFAALALVGHRPRTWRAVWQVLAHESLDHMRSIPWYAEHDMPTPLDCTVEEIELATEALESGLAAAGVRLAAVRSRAIFEPEFNELIERHGSKGTALSHETLALAARLIGAIKVEAASCRFPHVPTTSPTDVTRQDAAYPSISLVCDKHGGRDHYGPLLQHHFPEWLVEVHGEGREQSNYRFGPPERRIAACFRTKAESCLPAALASMASKYLRELAMQPLNEFWSRHVPNLQPTAGYPQDAKRFRVDIAEAQKELHISDRLLWRMR
jgi:hypothetical protein